MSERAAVGILYVPEKWKPVFGQVHGDKKIEAKFNRPIWKRAYAREVPGDLGAQDRSVRDVHEERRLKSTIAFLKEEGVSRRRQTKRLFQKKQAMAILRRSRV